MSDSRSTVDFAALRERLAEARDRRAADPRAVLEARARVLARPVTVSGVTAADAVELLVMRRGEAAFAIPVAQVLDVVRVQSLTPLPGADAPVIAVLPWRGRLLTVVDLATSAASVARVVVVQSGGAAVGIACDVVDDVRALPAAAIHPADGDALIRGTTDDALSLLDAAVLARRVAATR
jgi:chemotaxis signal transduction protein